MSFENKENEKTLSKNAILILSKKAGIKCLSSCGIEKVREMVDKKLKDISENLSHFYTSQNSKSSKYTKTVTSKIVSDFLEIDGVNITSDKEL